MGVLCPLCGKEHIGIDRVLLAVQEMLVQVHVYEQRQAEAQVARLLKPRYVVVINDKGQKVIGPGSK